MYNRIIEIINSINLSLVDDNSINILDTKIYKRISNINPKFKKIFNYAIKVNEYEFKRTIRHTFRVLLVYLLVLDKKFKLPCKLRDEDLQKLLHLINNINNKNEKILPLIFLIHDLGKPFNQKFHPKESAKIIDENNLLDDFNLNFEEKLIIKKVIEYHLMMGTINNGESSLWALKNLINDPEMWTIINTPSLLNLYLDILVVFAIFDIWGYFYGIVSINSLNQYLELRRIFHQLLLIKDNEKEFKKLLNNLSFNRIEWRISNAIRIFQYFNSGPNFTMIFFLKRIWDAIEKYNGDKINLNNWIEYKKKYFANTVRVQMTYGLPVLMRLAMGSFKKRRWKIDENTIINSDLIEFWIALNEKIEIFLNKKDFLELPINIIFDGLPHWTQYNKRILELLKGKMIRKIIKLSKLELKENKHQYNLILNFNN